MEPFHHRSPAAVIKVFAAEIFSGYPIIVQFNDEKPGYMINIGEAEDLIGQLRAAIKTKQATDASPQPDIEHEQPDDDGAIGDQPL